MTKLEISDLVKKLLIQNQTKEAIEAMSVYAKGLDADVENNLVMQMSNYNRIETAISKGTLTNEEQGTKFATLNNAITLNLNRLPKIGNKVDAKIFELIDKGPSARAVSPTLSKNILFLSASPTDEDRLRVDKELREIKDNLSAATHRDSINLISESAVKVATITKAMQKQYPNIVHFSGHGEGVKGIAVEDDNGKTVLFPTKGLERLFKLFKDKVECVFLNACYSSEQAEAISKQGIYVLGMNKDIEDTAAIDFAVGFYQSLGEGNSYEFAYGIAMVNLSTNLDDSNAAELWLDGKKLDL